MFDIGFSEILVFGAIALIVLGPDKLPQAARTAGKWYAKARRTVSTLQSEIEAELDLAETRKKMQEELTKIREAEAQMQQEMQALRGSMKKFEQENKQILAAESPNHTDDLTKDELEDSSSISAETGNHCSDGRNENSRSDMVDDTSYATNPIQHDEAGYPPKPQPSDALQSELIDDNLSTQHQSVNLQKTTSQGSNNL